MNTADLSRLFALAAVWGASFLLFRIAVPSIGALATTEAAATEMRRASP